MSLEVMFFFEAHINVLFLLFHVFLQTIMKGNNNDHCVINAGVTHVTFGFTPNQALPLAHSAVQPSIIGNQSNLKVSPTPNQSTNLKISTIRGRGSDICRGDRGKKEVERAFQVRQEGQNQKRVMTTRIRRLDRGRLMHLKSFC